MAHQNEEVVRESFAAFGRGDIDAAQKYWTDDIRCHVAGRSPIAGDFEGQKQMVGEITRLSALSGGTYSAEMHDVLANDEHAVALLTSRAERAGKQLNDNQVLVYHFRDGKIAEMWIQVTDQYAVDEFWS